MKRHSNIYVFTAFLLIILSSQACGPVSVTADPYISTPINPSREKPPSGGESPQSGTQKIIKSSQSDSRGIASYLDPSLNRQVAAEVSDTSTGQPLKDISVTFISDNLKLLIVVDDPSKKYFSAMQEIEYTKIVSINGRPSSSLAAMRKQGELVVAIFLLKTIDAIQTGKDWIDAIGENPPHLDRWGFLSQDYCVNGDQIATGLSRVLGTALFILPGPSDMISNIPALGDFSDWGWLAALADMTGVIAGDRAQNTLAEHVASGGAIVKWRVYTINGIPFGAPAIPIGWCLEPLDRNSANSVADWIRYSLRERELYAFKQLIPEGEISSGVLYTEAGGRISGEEFLNNLRQSLPNGIRCELISINPGESAVSVVTSGWNPPFVVPEIINLMTGEVSATNVQSKNVLISTDAGYIISAGIWTRSEVDDLLELFKMQAVNSQPCK